MTKAIGICVLAMVAGAAHAQSAARGGTQLFFEDFEDSTIGYIATPGDSLGDAANNNYFGRFAPDTSPEPSSVSLANDQGDGYYAAQDTDGIAGGGNIDVITLDILGVVITGEEGLEFSLFVAEDDAADGLEDWDLTSSLLVEYQIDGGGYAPLFAIESEFDGVDENNSVPRVDTNFDGVGDGTAITNVFTEFTSAIPGSGDALDIRITITELTSGEEDVAIDSLRVVATGADPSCNPADLAEPYGVLDFSDVFAFLKAFGGGCP